MIALLLIPAIILIGSGYFFLFRFTIHISVFFRHQPAAVGFLILSAFTSLPEIFCVLYSIYFHYTSVPFPLVIGSNVFNFTLLLGLVVWRYPVRVSGFHREEDLWVQILFGFILFLNFIYTSKIHPVTFIIFFILFILFGYLVRKSVLRNLNERQLPASSFIKTHPVSSLIYGVILTFFGSIFLVESGQAVSFVFGGKDVLTSALLIGSITSIPEFLLTIYLIRKNISSVAISNLMGSGVFNWVVVFVFPLFFWGNSDDSSINYRCMFGAYFFSLIAVYFYMYLKRKTSIKLFDSLFFMAIYILFGYWLFFC
ncbi:hypothetical protein [Thermaurantimonas aggregans]|uniref:hypothetical protein n=1 Tax=Thermaurantimonas aggregans TaxID=2173829 RepID=UPI0023F1B50F|nr:hypothetical protein [Thermaurantimonas aggregans]MCX8148537.1 hypothetical protein [Thermaurantimonas aggregans]